MVRQEDVDNLFAKPGTARDLALVTTGQQVI